MKQIKNKKDALINLSLLFYMKNNTNDKNLKELAENLSADIMNDHKLSEYDFLKVVRNLNQFIKSFDNE